MKIRVMLAGCAVLAGLMLGARPAQAQGTQTPLARLRRVLLGIR